MLLFTFAPRLVWEIRADRTQKKNPASFDQRSGVFLVFVFLVFLLPEFVTRSCRDQHLIFLSITPVKLPWKTICNAQFREKVIAWVVETFEKYSIFELQSDGENTKIESFDKDGVIRIAVGITTEWYTILAEQIRIDQHLYLAFLVHRDYFARSDASLSGSFAPQGLLCPGQMHLCLALLLHRDYFDRPDASLTCSFAPQRLFRPAECISIWLFCTAGIISTDRIHPSLALLCRRDYFGRSDSSQSYSFMPQGLFRPTGCIPSLEGHR